MRSIKLGIISLCACASLVSGCAISNTQILSSWRDPGVSTVSFHKVLAVAMVRNEQRRRQIEDRMAMDIQRYGAIAVPSYQLISAADTRNDEAVKAAMAQNGFDGAVTWHTVGVNDETHYVPGVMTSVPIGYTGFYGYYHTGWATVYDPGYLETDKHVRVETGVYALTTGSDKLVWMGTSDTVDPASLDSLVDSVSDATIEAMRAEGMFEPRRGR
jgi:hypothetical protein